ncbi:hypothetical protein Q8A73_001903 [Channa argus]|nr:hypothetical protein Q8A73_001903 [Channa argus]
MAEGDIVNMVYEVEVSPGHIRAGHERRALGLHFTNKLSLLQTGGKAAPHFFSFHFQYPTPLMAGGSLQLPSPPGNRSVLAAAAKGPHHPASPLQPIASDPSFPPHPRCAANLTGTASADWAAFQEPF